MSPSNTYNQTLIEWAAVISENFVSILKTVQYKYLCFLRLCFPDKSVRAILIVQLSVLHVNRLERPLSLHYLFS